MSNTVRDLTLAGGAVGSLRRDEAGRLYYGKIVRARNLLYAGTADESIALDAGHLADAHAAGALYLDLRCADDGRVWCCDWVTWDRHSRPTPWAAYGQQRMMATSRFAGSPPAAIQTALWGQP